MSTGIIYCAHNIQSGKKYIGQTKRKFQDRINQHKRTVNRVDCHFYSAIKKYGWDSFVWGIIEECDVELLNEREIYWIKEFSTNSDKFGYNMTEGGYFGMTEEQMREHGRKQGLINYKNKRGIHSLDKQQIIENARKGGLKNKELQKGFFKYTKEELIKVSQKGGQIAAEKKAKEFTLVSPLGDTISTKNIAQFSRLYDLDPSAISKVLLGKQKKHKGWTIPK